MIKTLLNLILIIFHLFFCSQLLAQLISGPMLGYIEHRTAKIWCEIGAKSNATLQFWPINKTVSPKLAFPNYHSAYDYKTVVFDLVGLEPGQEYAYQITIDKKDKSERLKGTFKTQVLWKYRIPAPDFSFIAGSCNYINQPIYDRPGKPYGSDSIIFLSMAKEKAEFMLWLGDSWYTREVDFQSEWGLWNRASRDRAVSEIQPIFRSMSHFAIWDDHDYGPNNEGLSYIFQEESRKVFMAYTANPTYGLYDKGIYSKISYNDVDLFMMDNRTWRSSDDMLSNINNIPNSEKLMFGQEQINWLKNSLLNSYAPFKIIVTGSQVLNEVEDGGDCFYNYPVEYNDLMNFLNVHKINGVIFLTGDKHHSEIIKKDREMAYPLYDVTVSSLTAGISKVKKEFINQSNRIPNTLVEEHNYGRFTVSGKPKERVLQVEFVNISGQSKSKWLISENDLRYNKK